MNCRYYYVSPDTPGEWSITCDGRILGLFESARVAEAMAISLARQAAAVGRTVDVRVMQEDGEFTTAWSSRRNGPLTPSAQVLPAITSATGKSPTSGQAFALNAVAA